MNIPKELTTVTSLSKILAAVLFIFLPILTFILGVQYGEMNNQFGQHIYTPAFQQVVKNTDKGHIYRDKQFNFSFELPKSFDITYSPEKNGSTYYETLASQNESFKSTNGSELQKMLAIEVTPSSSLEIWSKENKLNDPQKFILKEEIYKNGDKIIKFTYRQFGQTQYSDRDRFTGFVTEHKGIVVFIALGHYDNNQKDAEELINSIVDTFRFNLSAYNN